MEYWIIEQLEDHEHVICIKTEQVDTRRNILADVMMGRVIPSWV